MASLLRLKDNNCHLVEAERVLKKASKFTELVNLPNIVPWTLHFNKFSLLILFPQVILYNTRGLHRKALELLSAHSSREDSPLQGTSRTVTYVQVLSLLNSANKKTLMKLHLPPEFGSSAHRVDP